MQKSIKIDEHIYNRLNEIKHPGQSFQGVIEELMNKATGKGHVEK